MRAENSKTPHVVPPPGLHFAPEVSPANRVELGEGFEPSAYGVRNRCSSVELPQHVGGVVSGPLPGRMNPEVVQASVVRRAGVEPAFKGETLARYHYEYHPMYPGEPRTPGAI